MIERMLDVAEIWSEQTGRTLTALADQVVSSSQFFERVRAGRDITLRNYARMCAFLVDRANWRAETIPEHAGGLVDRIKHDLQSNASGESASSDKGGADIPPAEPAAMDDAA